MRYLPLPAMPSLVLILHLQLLMPHKDSPSVAIGYIRYIQNSMEGAERTSRACSTASLLTDFCTPLRNL